MKYICFICRSKDTALSFPNFGITLINSVIGKTAWCVLLPDWIFLIFFCLYFEHVKGQGEEQMNDDIADVSGF